jgi:hypothetical protein
MGRLARHVAKWGRREVFWWRNLRKRDHLENPGVDRRIILTRIIAK